MAEFTQGRGRLRICGRDPGRVLAATRDALEQGLEVWLSPEYWSTTPARTLEYLTAVAAAAEPLRERWPDQLDPNPRHDHDATALSLVRTLPSGQRGITYPDMAWEPKQAFPAVADFYASQSAATR